MNTLKVALLAGVALIGLAGVSRADTVSGGSITYTHGTDYYTQLGNLSLFNASAGTLTAVTFTAGYGFTSAITITAGAQGAQGNTFTESAADFQSSNSSIQAVLDSLINTAAPAVIGSSTLSPDAYDYMGPKQLYNLAANASATYNSNIANTTTTYNDTKASDLSAFLSTSTGSPTFDIYGKTLTGTTNTYSSGNSTAASVTNATQTISVLYTYTAAAVPPTTSVPEPASLALLGAGLIGAGMIRRKNRA